MNRISRVDMILSINRALLGEVSCTLRKVNFAYDDNFIYFQFFYDPDLDDDDRDSASTIAGNVSSDFPEHELKEDVISGDAIPQDTPANLAWETAFLRR